MKAECPLCKGKFSSILYNIRSITSIHVKVILIHVLFSWGEDSSLASSISKSLIIIPRSDSEYDSYPLPPPSPRAEGGLQEYLYTTRRFSEKLSGKQNYYFIYESGSSSKSLVQYNNLLRW